jgi:hypothetical protein
MFKSVGVFNKLYLIQLYIIHHLYLHNNDNNCNRHPYGVVDTTRDWSAAGNASPPHRGNIKI